MNAVKEIIKFQKTRELDKMTFNMANEATNIMEEILEAMGYNVPSVKRIDLLNEVIRTLDLLITSDIVETSLPFSKENMDYERIDAFGDIIVFAIGAIEKLGYNAEKVLKQISKEINSREGTIIDGKFEKNTSREAIAKWYKADFTKAKRIQATPTQRNAFFKVEGYMGDDREVIKWIKSLSEQVED